MSRITQQQLESYLWGAAVLLRGLIDAGDYKQFIFPLLFYKRVSDVWDEEYQAALANSGGDLSSKGTRMSSTIRIKRSGPGRLFFEVHSEGAGASLTSAHYSTICKIEAGLALLFAAAFSPGALRIEPGDGATMIGLKDKRGRVPFVGQIPESLLLRAIFTIASAQVVDDRPPERRRTVISGRLCDLHH